MKTKYINQETLDVLLEAGSAEPIPLFKGAYAVYNTEVEVYIYDKEKKLYEKYKSVADVGETPDLEE